MALFPLRLPSNALCKGCPQLRQHWKARYIPDITTSVRARTLTSTTNRRNNAGLAHLPIQEDTIFDSMGHTKGLSQTQSDKFIPTSTARPGLPPRSLHRDITDLSTASHKAEIHQSPWIETAVTPAYHIASKFDRVPYWQNIGRWKDVSEDQFLSYTWNVCSSIIVL